MYVNKVQNILELIFEMCHFSFFYTPLIFNASQMVWTLVKTWYFSIRLVCCTQCIVGSRPLFPQWSHHVYPQFLPGSHPNSSQTPNSQYPSSQGTPTGLGSGPAKAHHYHHRPYLSQHQHCKLSANHHEFNHVNNNTHAHVRVGNIYHRGHNINSGKRSLVTNKTRFCTRTVLSIFLSNWNTFSIHIIDFTI